MFRDRAQDALRIAAIPTLDQVRRDRERARGKLKKLFTYVARRLFHPELDAKRAWLGAGLRDHTLTAAFKDVTGTSLKRYEETSLRAGRGDFDPEEAREYLGKYLQLYPYLAQELEPAPNATLQPRIVVDGARHAQLVAEELWREIRDLQFEDQRSRVRQYLFRSTALFDLLREKSRLEGRQDRQRCIDLAKLALVSLKESDEIFGERILDLRAIGYAWLGNAHRLALEFSAAGAAFERSDVEWLKPGAPHGLLIAAEIDLLKGSLRMSQRRYPEALDLVYRSRDLFREAEDASGEMRALIQQAAIHGYAGNSGDAIPALEEAASLLDQQEDPFLALVVYCNLANDQLKLELYSSASKSIRKCRRYRRSGGGSEFLQILWLEGGIKQGTGDLSVAEQLLTAARPEPTGRSKRRGAAIWLAPPRNCQPRVRAPSFLSDRRP